MANRIKVLWLLLIVFCLAGCAAEKENALWSIPTENQTLLVTQSGKTVWQGNGDAVENQWGNVLVTDWQTGEPIQTLFEPSGRILMQTQPNEQIMQLSERLIAVQNAQQQWILKTPQGKQYRFERADLQKNGDILLCGVDNRQSVRLDKDGNELKTFSQEMIWSVDEPEGWYQTPNGELIDPQGKVVYENVERMLGDGKVLVKQDEKYCVFDVQSQKKIDCGTKNWRLYLEHLKIEQLEEGFLAESEQTEFLGDSFALYPIEDEIFCYSLKNSQKQLFWNRDGIPMFESEPLDWVQPIDENSIAAVSDQTLQLLSAKGQTVWKKQGYACAWTQQTEQGTVICAVNLSGMTDVFSQTGECLFEGIEQVYQISQQGIVCLKQDKMAVFGWNGDCLYQNK